MVKVDSKICDYSLISRFDKKNVGLTLYDGGLSFICSANKWTSFYMIGTSAMNELNKEVVICYVVSCCCCQVKYIQTFE